MALMVESDEIVWGKWSYGKKKRRRKFKADDFFSIKFKNGLKGHFK